MHIVKKLTKGAGAFFLFAAILLLAACENPAGSQNYVQGVLTFTVTFDLAGGSYAGNGNLLTQTVSQGQDASELSRNPTSIGHTFLGWNPELDLTDITSDRTFTAQWWINASPPSTQTFTATMTNDGRGTASASQTTATVGTQIIITATPNSADYQFLHWVVVSGGVALSPNVNTNPATFTMPSGNVEIRAEFELSPQGILANEVVRIHNNGNPHISVPGLVGGLPHTINTGLELSTGVTLVTEFLGDVYATERPPNVIWADLFVGTADNMLVLAILATPSAASGNYVFNDVRLRHTASGVESEPFTLIVNVP